MQNATFEVTGSNSSDVQMALRIAGDDRDAFRQLMRRHNQTLFRTARSIVKDDAEAEDAVQEAWLRAYAAIGSYRGEAKLSTWLTRIVVNEAIGRLRKRDRAAQVVRTDVEFDADAEGAAAEGQGGVFERPDRAALRSELRRLLESAIDALPEGFRTVFVLRAVEDMTVEEAAAILGIPDATVRTRFFRARAMLRESLAREIDSAHDDVFAFAGSRCDRIVAGVLARLGDWAHWRCLMTRDTHPPEK
jgi:RNA polymerase sigma-70 factor (ECF subfamily)